MTPDAFAAAYDVSRETVNKLTILATRLERWSGRINLVGRGTLPNLWDRHIADSAQLFPLRPDPCRAWLDLGSGAGFPGLVVAALAETLPTPPPVTLVESDSRKAAFLADAAHAMALAPMPRIVNARIETLGRLAPSVISARALAPLADLLALARPIAGPDTVLIFPKGARVDSELTAARHDWHIDCQSIPSRTDSGAEILRITRFTGIEQAS